MLSFFCFTQSRSIMFNISFLVYLHAGGSGVRLYDGFHLKLFIFVVGAGDFSSVAWPTGLTSHGSPDARKHVASLESSSLIVHGTLCDLFVLP